MTISRRQRLADAALTRVLGAPKQRNSYTVHEVRVPMRDGVTLLADHYAPDTPAQRGTVLIRTPYGRGFPTSGLNGRMFAARGYHVVVQSVRGTFGSGGSIEPMAQETDDGQDTVAWLRTQPWFDDRLGTLGGSYLGWTQWALLQDPPPELRTAIVYVSPHDFREAVFGRGAFTLGDFLGWSNQIITQEYGGGLSRLARGATAGRTLAPVLAGLPLADAADPLLRGRAPWYRTWLSHPDGDDPFWGPYRAGAALRRVNVPVLLVGGWQDMFLDQTLEQYATLRDRGIDVALTVGPWTHLDAAIRASGLINRESLDWLDAQLAGEPRVREQPVRVFRTGENAWHELPSWPPPATPATYHLHPEGYLTEKSGGVPGTVRFRYDPTDPTPSVGGRVMSGTMGVRDNRRLEARADVVTFTSDRLATAIDVVGAPVVRLAVTVDNPYADVFVRLCDVDERGHSHNVSDVLHRLDPTVPAGEPHHLTLTLDPCFHRLLPGHRVRLQISGGAFPRYARNLGTEGPPATGNTLKPSEHEIDCAASTLTLPEAA
jgi:putative CocE/NonD family hydrolase